jgi:hypothetical protein
MGAYLKDSMWEGYYDIQCKNLSVVPFQDIKACVGMKQQVRGSQKNTCTVTNIIFSFTAA